VTSAELRIPVFCLPIPGLSRTEEDRVVPIAPFADFGWADNTDQPTPSPQTIYRTSLGLRWGPNQRIHTELYWGCAGDVGNPDNGLQDSGIHYRVEIDLSICKVKLRDISNPSIPPTQWKVSSNPPAWR
jgi:hypothetical protein